MKPGVPGAITAPAEAMLLGLLTVAARQGLLRVGPVEATTQVPAANAGATLSLIAEPEGRRDLGLGDRIREAALAGVLRAGTGPAPDFPAASRASLAIALAAAIDQDPRGLT